MKNKIILKMDKRKVIVDYNVLGLKQLIQFLELEVRLGKFSDTLFNLVDIAKKEKSKVMEE